MSAGTGDSVTTHTVIVEGAPVLCTLSGIDQHDSDPVVLLPGVGGSTASEFSFLLPLLARTRRVLAVDLRYGSSEVPGIDGLLDQLAEVLRQLLPGRRVTLVGFSVGATVAASFAAQNPAAQNPAAQNPGVVSLVLVTPVLRASNRHRLLAVLRSTLSAGDPTALRSLDIFSAYSSNFLEEHSPEPFPAGVISAAQFELFAETELTDALPRITIPTLVVGCTHDDLAGVEGARTLFAALPNARYAEIDSGHAVLAERPAEVLAIIREFVSHPLRHRAGSVWEAARP
jgi:pimeloyl-ACP methyl ester carboxylesterase